MEYQELVYYLSLMLILGAVAEIYVRQKGLGQREEKMRDGSKIVTNRRSILPPFGLLLLSIVVAVLTAPK